MADDILIQKKIRELFSSYHEEINALSAQLRALKEASHNNVVAMSPPPQHVAVAKNGPTVTAKNIFVKIAVSGSSEIHEFPTDENGNLQVESVVAVYQGQYTQWHGSTNTLGSRYPNKAGVSVSEFLPFCSDTETHGINKVVKNSKMAFSQLLS